MLTRNKPEQLNDAADQYFVLEPDGYDEGSFREDRTLGRVVADICIEQYEPARIGRVLRINIDDKSCGDATEDVARAVAERMHRDGDKASWDLLNWLERYLDLEMAKGLYGEDIAQ